jgi:hypothetical protein
MASLDWKGLNRLMKFYEQQLVINAVQCERHEWMKQHRFSLLPQVTKNFVINFAQPSLIRVLTLCSIVANEGTYTLSLTTPNKNKCHSKKRAERLSQHRRHFAPTYIL